MFKSLVISEVLYKSNIVSRKSLVSLVLVTVTSGLKLYGFEAVLHFASCVSDKGSQSSFVTLGFKATVWHTFYLIKKKFFHLTYWFNFFLSSIFGLAFVLSS